MRRTLSPMVNVEGSLSADLIAQQNFSAARRGFDPEEVRAFLVKVGAEIMALHERQAALEDARRDAEYRAAHPSFDEETLFGAVGDETAHILKSAHEAAADIKARAGENASRILKEGHQQAEALRAEAETVLARRTEEAEGVAGRIRESAKVEAERLLDQSRQQSKAIRAQAEAERNAMIEGAQATREKILSALSKKRNVAVAQVEQLRAGRERLLEAYQVVRLTLDQATAELARAETEARAAADAIRHRPLALDEPDGLGDEGDPPTNPTLPIIQRRLQAVAARPALPSPPAAASAPPPAPVPTMGGAPPPAPASSPPRPTLPTPPATASAPPPERLTPPAPPPPPAPAAPAVTTAEHPPENEADTKVVATPPASVESLFARIRADRDKAVAHAREVLAEEQPVADDDEVLLQRRDAVLEPIESGLARRFKRALQDDQNDLLDRLRNVRASQKAAAAVLAARDAHAARFRDLGRPFLGEAMSAGVGFVATLIPGVKGSDHLGRLDASAGLLADAIVDPLRRRLESVLAAGEGDDPIVLAEAVGAAYREWKTKRVETVTADHVAAAFTMGVYAATPAGATLRWVVEDADGPCSDCDDNALAGGQPKGESFPTGQKHPPAHPGCRCLLVPKLS